MMRTCPDCAAEIGKLHSPGCDVEACPRCGGQAISCGCIYEVCGMDRANLEEEHPEIYSNGPTKEMEAQWDSEWGARRIAWSGEFPGSAECREFGWFSKWTEGQGWQRCDSSDPEAWPDLNRLREARWDVDAQRWVMSREAA